MKSKKLIIIEIVISVVAVLCVSIIIIVFIQINKSINDKIDNVIEETFKEESKIQFDLTIPPNKQREKIIKFPEEYLSQVYEQIIPDKKIRDCMPCDILTGYEIVDDFSGIDNLFMALKKLTYRSYIIAVFTNENVPIIDLPVTDNYIANHPQPLRQEYKEYYKENYNTSDKDIINNEIHKYLCSYKYEVGINEENKTIILSEYKEIEHLNDDGTTYPAWGKEGSDLENQELSRGHIRDIVFKYTLSDNGYLDDVEFDHITNYMDDKYFDEIKS